MLAHRIPHWISVAVLAFVTLPGPAQDHDAAWVAQRVRTLMDAPPQAWTQIPWAGSLAEARRLAEQENRPIFLFTEDGDMSTGRC
jgi:hypothetical protein